MLCQFCKAGDCDGCNNQPFVDHIGCNCNGAGHIHDPSVAKELRAIERRRYTPSIFRPWPIHRRPKSVNVIAVHYNHIDPA